MTAATSPTAPGSGRAGDALGALARFTANTRLAMIPRPVVTKAQHHVLDTLGAALAGSASTETTALLQLLAASEPGGAGTVWGTGPRVAPRAAALVNGVSAHALELDDAGGCDHSGAVVVPAALAAAEVAEHPVSGARLLAAVIVGYDVARRVLEACGGYAPHNEAGWHSTGTCGPFGAAAAAAAVLGLGPDSTAHALALSASFSGGIWAFVHDGAMSKRLHAGRAAEAGLTAALAARHGITGPRGVFDDTWGGFLRTIAPGSATPAALTARLGDRWCVSRCSIKPYASCRSTHSSVDAVAGLLADHELGPDDVASVHVRLSAFIHGMCGAAECGTLAAAQLSLPYAVAVRVALGTADLTAYSAESRASPAVRSVLDRITLEVDESMTGDTEPVITLTTRTGACHTGQVTDPLGSPTNPLDSAAVTAKFHGLATRVLDPAVAHTVADTVRALPDLPDVRVLLSALATTAPGPGAPTGAQGRG
ncbi:MmgE/PrpD family protein [Streptomyces sp. NBC_00440]|uniref:MmgE/PrpD family protein n=1 Tax=Streptomyces sp. NBC_00440 TaxID=2975741 RepID=UPI002E1B4C51